VSRAEIIVRAFSLEERSARRDAAELRCSVSAHIAIASAKETDAMTKNISGEAADDPAAKAGEAVHGNRNASNCAARLATHIERASRGIKLRKLPVPLD
jgi:hypothetical protein